MKRIETMTSEESPIRRIRYRSKAGECVTATLGHEPVGAPKSGVPLRESRHRTGRTIPTAPIDEALKEGMPARLGFGQLHAAAQVARRYAWPGSRRCRRGRSALGPGGRHTAVIPVSCGGTPASRLDPRNARTMWLGQPWGCVGDAVQTRR